MQVHFVRDLQSLLEETWINNSLWGLTIEKRFFKVLLKHHSEKSGGFIMKLLHIVAVFFTLVFMSFAMADCGSCGKENKMDSKDSACAICEGKDKASCSAVCKGKDKKACSVCKEKKKSACAVCAGHDHKHDHGKESKKVEEKEADESAKKKKADESAKKKEADESAKKKKADKDKKSE